MQQVLIIGKVWPEPNSSAAGSRTLQLIELFKTQGWKIAFACAARESEYCSDIEALGVTKYAIELNNNSFDEFVKSLNPTLVIFDRFTLEEQFGWRVAEACPDALRVLDTIDLHCLRDARHRAIKEKREFVLSDLISDVAKRELASIYRSDVSLMISNYEMELLQNYFKVDGKLLHYTPFLLNPISEEEQFNWTKFSEREHFISIGNFLHEPNWDSVLFLKHDIWPLIRKQLPKAELHIYGAYPSHKVFQLHNLKEGFIIKGRAEDAEMVMKNARVCLAPLRFGAGMKGKLIDSMLYGTPNVATSIGAEAMHENLDWNGKIENTPQSIANAAIELYANELLWKQSQENGKIIINQVFEKEKHGKALIEKLLFVLNSLKNHREQNFIGAMLMQQTVSSTKYMSLWIEAKNKLGKKE